MKKIVLSAIAAIVLTVGVYWVVLAFGASQEQAFAVVASVAFAVAAAAASASAAAASASAAAAAAASAAFAVVASVAFAGAASAASAAAFVAVVAAFVAVVAASAAAIAAEQEGIRFRWALVVYGLEALAIWGALAVGGPVWSACIAATGIVAITGAYFLWRAIAPEAGRKSIPAHEQNPA